MKRWAILACAVLSGAQSAKADYSAEEIPVLYAPVSARASALGNAVFCSEQDGIRYNPAFLGGTGTALLEGTYGAYPRGTTFGNVSLLLPSGPVGWGIGFGSVRAKFDGYSGPDDEAAQRVQVSQSLISLAAGFPAAGDVLLGAALRMIIDSIGETSGSVFGMDLGAGYRFSERASAGIVLGNAVSSGGAGEDRPQLRTTVSAGWRPVLALPGQDGDDGNILHVSIAKYILAQPELSLGWESVWGGAFAFRAGLDRNYPALGAGLTSGSVQFDTAALFKGQGPVYFITVGWSFGEAGKPVAAAGKTIAGKTPRNAAGGTDAAASKNARKDDGRAEENRKTVQPGDGDKKSSEFFLNRGRECMAAGEYGKAVTTFRFMLNTDPGNGHALQGIRGVVEAVSRALAVELARETQRSYESAALTADEALRLCKNGCFDSINAARVQLEGRKYREACNEWDKAASGTEKCFPGYGAGFDAIRVREIRSAVKRAAATSEKGAYREAVRELEYLYGYTGITREERNEIRGLVATYEYMGNTVARTFLPEARKLIGDGQHAKAAMYLRRVLQCGYQADEANRLLKEIEPRLRHKENAR